MLGDCSEISEKMLRDFGCLASKFWVFGTKCWVFGTRIWVFGSAVGEIPTSRNLLKRGHVGGQIVLKGSVVYHM